MSRDNQTTESGVSQSNAVSATRSRAADPMLAFLSGLAIPPFGQLYIGRLRQGVVLFVVGAVIFSIAVAVLVYVPVHPLNALVSVTLIIGFHLYSGTDAGLRARKDRDRYAPRRRNSRPFYMVALPTIAGLMAGVFIVLRTAWIAFFVVPSGGMADTVLPGDRLLADRLVYYLRDPRRLEVVVYNWPKEPDLLFIHRVIGLPGETIEVRNDRVFVNGNSLDEPYAAFKAPASTNRPEAHDMAPVLIPAGQYFVIGDNRLQSADSRVDGCVPRQAIVARAMRIYLSNESKPWRQRFRWERIGLGLD